MDPQSTETDSAKPKFQGFRHEILLLKDELTRIREKLETTRRKRYDVNDITDIASESGAPDFEQIEKSDFVDNCEEWDKESECFINIDKVVPNRIGRILRFVFYLFFILFFKYVCDQLFMSEEVLDMLEE